MSAKDFLYFPDLSVRTEKSGDDLYFNLSTFNPDHDDDLGHARDFGKSIVEDGCVDAVDFDDEKLKQLFSLLEHAPDLFQIVQEIAEYGETRDGQTRCKRLVDAIKRGDTKYPVTV